MLEQFWREHRRSRTISRQRLVVSEVPAQVTLLVERAAAVFQAPIAILSIIEGRNLWIKAGVGFNEPWLPRGSSFCQYAIDRGSVLEVCDATADARFRDLPVVTGAQAVRYYIGTSLVLPSGPEVGALCVVDTQPRPACSADQRAYLLALARQCAELLDRPEAEAA